MLAARTCLRTNAKQRATSLGHRWVYLAVLLAYDARLYIYIYNKVAGRRGAGHHRNKARKRVLSPALPYAKPLQYTASRERTELKDKSAKRNLYGFTKHGACFSVERKQLEMQMGLGH